MMDRSEEGSESKDAIGKSPRRSSSGETEQNKKTCADCGTTKTPLWRGGPAGPKSLCNACGIRSRKKKRSILGLNRGGEVERKAKSSSNRSINGGGNHSKIGDSLKRRLLAFGREELMQRRQMGEEEQAAVLLMALSYGSVCA